jgi:hypothetical protein
MKLQLKVRFLGRGGRVSSPTSTTGHLVHIAFFLVWNAIPGAGLLYGPFDWRAIPFLVAGGTMLLLALGDAIAGAPATDPEREKFRREVEMLQPLPRVAPQNQTLDGMAALAMATLMFGFMGVILWRELRPMVLIPALGWLYVATRVMFTASKRG